VLTDSIGNLDGYVAPFIVGWDQGQYQEFRDGYALSRNLCVRFGNDHFFAVRSTDANLDDPFAKIGCRPKNLQGKFSLQSCCAMACRPVSRRPGSGQPSAGGPGPVLTLPNRRNTLGFDRLLK